MCGGVFRTVTMPCGTMLLDAVAEAADLAATDLAAVS
jgi:hypothetical protein